MKKIRFCVLPFLGLVLFFVYGWLTPTQCQADDFDCELAIWYASMDASATVSTNFRLWYRNDPTSCSDEYDQQCNAIQDPVERSECINNNAARIAFINGCDSQRFSAFSSSQDAFFAAAGQTCSYNPNYCDNARDKRDQCNAAHSGHMASPVYDANNDIDQVWLSFVMDELSGCLMASQIHHCE